MLEHGGRLRAAARRHGIALADWLDLSTGINPRAYPVPPLPPTVWQRLPEADDGLESAAAAFYGNPLLLPVAGSQAAIQALPRLFPPAAVACIALIVAGLRRWGEPGALLLVEVGPAHHAALR